MKYVLLIVLVTHGGHAPAFQEFENRNACEFAMAAILKKSDTRPYFQVRSAMCIPKDDR